MNESAVIPLFPLGMVLVPGLVLPLHIFEQRYRELMADIEGLPEEDRAFGVVGIRGGTEVGESGAHDLFEVGTLAAVREVERLEDGRFDIVTVGSTRFRILELDRSRAYLRARVEFLDEEPGLDAERFARDVAAAFGSYRAMFTPVEDDLDPEDDDDADDDALPDDPGVLSYLVAAAVLAPLQQRQEFLAAPDDAARLRLELSYLRSEMGLIAALPSLPAIDLVREPYSPN